MSWLLENISYRKLAEYVVFLSIIFFSLFIFYNFGNALQILDQYISPSGQPVIVSDWDPRFMPPYYGPTPGGVIDVNQYGQIITPWGTYPNWENRWLLGAAGMYGPGSINLYSEYQYTGGGGPYWNFGNNPNPGPFFGTVYTGGGGPYWNFGNNPNPAPFFGTAYTVGGFLGVGDLPPVIYY